MAAALEFDGPANWHCMGVRYHVLSHGGVKPEGEPHPGGLHDSADAALDQFRSTFAAYVDGAEQIAYRRRPELTEEKGRFAVSCRLARYPQDWQK